MTEFPFVSDKNTLRHESELPSGGRTTSASPFPKAFLGQGNG